MFLTNGRRYTMRIDGFVSVNAPLAGGELLTKPLQFSGSKLEINYSTSAAGEVLVELQTVEGKAIPGFAFEDCKPIYGDHISRVVEWNNGADLSKLSDKPVRIRFKMSDADLYSIKFSK
jgi:hypothetical protein